MKRLPVGAVWPMLFAPADPIAPFAGLENRGKGCRVESGLVRASSGG